MKPMVVARKWSSNITENCWYLFTTFTTPTLPSRIVTKGTLNFSFTAHNVTWDFFGNKSLRIHDFWLWARIHCLTSPKTRASYLVYWASMFYLSSTYTDNVVLWMNTVKGLTNWFVRSMFGYRTTRLSLLWYLWIPHYSVAWVCFVYVTMNPGIFYVLEHVQWLP